MTDPRLADLQQSLPDLRLKTDAADLEHYGRDWTRRWTPAPLAIALPATVDEVQAVVRWANRHGVAVVPSGGRTGLSGGAVAANGELVLSLERMNKVLDFDAVDRTLTVQAGMALEAVQNAAREHGLVYPVDFGARGSCSIGGNIATNAGGIRVIRYGNTREWIAGLKVVAGNGAFDIQLPNCPTGYSITGAGCRTRGPRLRARAASSSSGRWVGRIRARRCQDGWGIRRQGRQSNIRNADRTAYPASARTSTAISPPFMDPR